MVAMRRGDEKTGPAAHEPDCAAPSPRALPWAAEPLVVWGSTRPVLARRGTIHSMRRSPLTRLFVATLIVLLCGCGDGSDDNRAPAPRSDAAQIPAVGPWNSGYALPAEAQTPGDPQGGRDLLLNGAYMSCGLPYKLWATPPLRALLEGGFGLPAQSPRLPERTGNNTDLPYFLNAFSTREGVQVVNANCLTCHGGLFDGQLIIGLGNPAVDFTNGAGGSAPSQPIPDALLVALGLNDGEQREFKKIVARAQVVGPATTMRTIGLNPAEQLAVTLETHHDRDTLAWSDTPLITIVIKDRNGQPIEDARLTSDPPPWWRAHKKNALFYNGMARGDHRGTMEYATSVCVDDLDRARQVDEWFKDIQAFITTIRAPLYPRAIDRALAGQGHPVFLKNCAGCHGTYADDPMADEQDTYPNLLIPLDVIGTDPAVAEAGVYNAPELVDWYNNSFYGQVTPLKPNDPFPGYMPPPLDGIWATAPYLHNGSVPTVELVLNSRARPTYWRRVDYDTTHFDEEALGWPYEALDTPQAQAPEAERKLIYDTTYWSQSNQGHPFGDVLTADERRAVIEYLKTL